MHSARVTVPIRSLDAGGKSVDVPVGPCMVEQTGADRVAVIWGAKGQKCVALALSEIVEATKRGDLLILD
jgi:hypothetical protein